MACGVYVDIHHVHDNTNIQHGIFLILQNYITKQVTRVQWLLVKFLVLPQKLRVYEREPHDREGGPRLVAIGIGRSAKFCLFA